MKEVISSAQAPAAIGPYSAGILTDSLVFISGQLPVNPQDGSIPEGIEAQTAQSIANIKALLKEQGLDLSSVVKTTVFLQDIAHFSAMNEIYGREFAAPYPTRSAFQVAALPKGALVEIECIAVRK